MSIEDQIARLEKSIQDCNCQVTIYSQKISLITEHIDIEKAFITTCRTEIDKLRGGE